MTNAHIQLIETMRVEPGNGLPLLDLHRQRLERSCRVLDYAWPGGQLTDAILQAASKLDSDRSHRLRLLLSADGSYTLEASLLADTQAPVLLYLDPVPLSAELFWLYHKSTHRPWYAQAGAWLVQNPGFFDVIFCNQKDEACEGSRSNLYVLNSAGVWLTPPLECGVLPGVQRQALLDRGAAQEAVISRRDLLDAREIRISNALRGWLPAVLE
jgi:4-amino-4-deoxychorismate lyase